MPTRVDDLINAALAVDVRRVGVVDLSARASAA